MDYCLAIKRNEVLTDVTTWMNLENIVLWGAWVTSYQVRHSTPDFGSGHDSQFVRLSPELSSVLTSGNLLGILSLPLFLSLFLSCARCLSQNK